MRHEQSAPPGANADRTEACGRELQPKPLAGLAAALAEITAHVRHLTRLAEECETEFARLTREEALYNAAVAAHGSGCSVRDA